MTVFNSDYLISVSFYDNNGYYNYYNSNDYGFELGIYYNYLEYYKNKKSEFYHEFSKGIYSNIIGQRLMINILHYMSNLFIN